MTTDRRRIFSLYRKLFRTTRLMSPAHQSLARARTRSAFRQAGEGEEEEGGMQAAATATALEGRLAYGAVMLEQLQIQALHMQRSMLGEAEEKSKKRTRVRTMPPGVARHQDLVRTRKKSDRGRYG